MTTTTTTTNESTPDSAVPLAPQSTETIATTNDDKNSSPPAAPVHTASEWKDVGNAAYAQQDYMTATAAYQQGLAVVMAVLAKKEEEEGGNDKNDDDDDNTNDDDDEETTTSTHIALRRTLYSNLAMVLLRQKDYLGAEAWCNDAFEAEKLQTTSSSGTSMAKLWYRRALAREGRVSNPRQSTNNGNDHSNQQDKVLLLQAKADLQTSLQELLKHNDDNNNAVSQKEMERMQESIGSMAQRLQRALLELDRNPPPSPEAPGTPKRKGGLPGGKAQPNTTPPRILPGASPLPQPDPKNQRQNVVRLLLARATAVRSSPALPGEAFFLVDWDWWCDWCAYVNLFDATGGTKKNGSTNAWALKMQSYLPAGAVLPDSHPQASSSDDDKDDDDDDQEASHPGPIDNRRLLFAPDATRSSNGQKAAPMTTRDIYFQHWYSHLDPTAAATPHPPPNGTGKAQHEICSVAPNLVRGHHYEVLPREVYAALRAWYGEVTPPICRRAQVSLDPCTQTPRLSLPLYPNVQAGRPTRGSNDADHDAARQYCDGCAAPMASSRCKRCMSVRYCARACQESHWPFHKTHCKAIVSATTADKDDPPLLASPPSLGKVGLNNLGNTCFMNSAIQALSHATPLTRHFLSSRFRNDLNPSNPLGTGGKLASAYETVMKDLWLRPGSTSTSPSALKRAIALFAPRFAGYLQHDTQEFLAYLLDGLHEDLNRILKAPYVEMPQVDDGHNMAVAGAMAWDAHRRRNDSLVMDTFYGQFKSTCVCPQCSRVSVSFDTFNHVSLEIPRAEHATMHLSFLVFGALGTNQKNSTPVVPTRYGLEVRRSSTVQDVRQELSSMTKIPMDRLVLCEAFDHVIVDMLKDNRPVSELRSNDFYVAYDISPSDSNSFHVITNHVLSETSNTTVGANNNTIQLTPFGFPLMTSFSADVTCRQVWNHVWELVGSMVLAPEVDGKQLLKIRLHSGRGKPIPAFRPAANDDDTEPMTDFEASLLPAELDKPLTDFLGVDAADNYLFLKLEWTDLEVPTEEDPAKPTTPAIDMERFLQLENDNSFVDMTNKLKANRNSRSVTLDQCFETFTKPERLDDNNKWYCSNCKEHVRALKTMELWRLPNILIVHLKRFEFKHALRRDKIDTLVDFPLDDLDMTAHCAASRELPLVDDRLPAEYDLFAVTNHFGRLGFGHYTAFARKWDELGIDKEWYLYDDSNVRSVGNGRGSGAGEVVSPAAYVLFYRRRTFA